MLSARYILDGKYEVVSILGQGGMGTVYLCRNNRLQNLWAIKEVTGQVRNHMDFFAEPDILKNLRHPGIPRVVDIFYENENLYMVEDYIEGETLEDLVSRTGKMEPGRICEISLKLCDIIGYLHGLNPPIIYRDLKPSNIMITPGGDVILVDFSISRIYKANKVQDTVLMGSKGFAAPEQYGGTQSNEQTDIYGLGATMYYMAAGVVPSSGQDFFETENSGIDRGLKSIIQKAVRPESQSRYMSINEVKDAVSLLMRKMLKTIVLDGKSSERRFEKTEVMQKPADTPEGRAKPKRNMKRILAGAIIFFILMAGMQYLLWQGKAAWSASKGTKSVSDGEGITATPSPTLTPSPTPTPTPTPPKDIAVEGVIYKNAPIVLSNNGKPKGKGKGNDEKDIFYKVNPAARGGRFNNKFIIELKYIEFKNGDAAVYCEIENNTGREIGISLGDTYLVNDRNESRRVDGSGTLFIKDGTDKKEIKIPFDDFEFDTKLITLKTQIISRDQVLSSSLNLIVNVE